MKKINLLFFLLFLMHFFGFAQSSTHSYNTQSDIVIKSDSKSVNQVYIFVLKDSAIIENSIIKKINNLYKLNKVDTNNFKINIIQLYTTINEPIKKEVDNGFKNPFSIANTEIVSAKIETAVCPKPKLLSINDIECITSIYYYPYFIVVDTANNFQFLKNSNVSNSNLKNITFFRNPSSQKTRILRIITDTTLFELISFQSQQPYVVNNPTKPNTSSVTNITKYKLQTTKPSNQYGFTIGLGSFLQQYKSASTTVGRSNQSFEKNPLFVNINGFYKTHLSEKVYLKFGLDLLYYSSSIYNKNLYSLPVSNTYITNPNYTINPTNPLAKTNYLVVGLSACAGYKVKLANKLLLNLEGGFCVGKSIHGWSAANFNVTQGASTTTIKNNSSFSDKISVYFIANPNIEYTLNKNCNLHFGLFSARGFSKMSSNSNYQFINDNGRYSALENAIDKISSQSLSFTTGISFNIK